MLNVLYHVKNVSSYKHDCLIDQSDRCFIWPNLNFAPNRIEYVYMVSYGSAQFKKK